jgi:hypothetical protein
MADAKRMQKFYAFEWDSYQTSWPISILLKQKYVDEIPFSMNLPSNRGDACY